MKAGIDFVGICTPFYCNNGKGNFLFHKRGKKARDEHGMWDMGGGELDFGLTLEQNVLKEVEEEYGCKGKIQEQLPPTTVFRKQNGKRTHWILIPFFILVNPKKVKNNEPEKIDEIGWFTLKNLPKPLHPVLKQDLKNYKKYFKKYVRS